MSRSEYAPPKTADGVVATVGMNCWSLTDGTVEPWVECGILAMWLDEDNDYEVVAKIRTAAGYEWKVDVRELFASKPEPAAAQTALRTIEEKIE